MKKAVLTVSVLAVVVMVVSTATAVPVANSQPVTEKISKMQKLLKNLPYQDGDYPILMTIFKILLYAYGFVLYLLDHTDAIHNLGEKIGGWGCTIAALSAEKMQRNPLWAIPFIVGIVIAWIGIVVRAVGDVVDVIMCTFLVPTAVILLLPLKLLARILGIDLDDPATLENLTSNQQQLQVAAVV